MYFLCNQEKHTRYYPTHTHTHTHTHTITLHPLYHKQRHLDRRALYLIGWSFPHSSVSKESSCNAGNPGSIPGSGRSPGEGNGNPLQYSCLENSINRGAWQATVHGVTMNWTWLNDYLFTSFPFSEHALLSTLLGNQEEGQIFFHSVLDLDYFQLKIICMPKRH